MIGELLCNLREKRPLIHCITNYVTANDCANILLALGASPVMADSCEDVGCITPKCDALCINLGTLKRESVKVMLKAGKIANELAKPVILDPAGAGASQFRLESALELIEKIKFSVIRANASEVKALSGGGCEAGGVDAVFDGAESENADLAMSLAKKVGAAVILSGETDVVADKNGAAVIRGGSAMMSKITGCGCMMTSISAAFAAVGGGINSCLAASALMKACGEKAEKDMPKNGGTMTFKNMMIDRVYLANAEELERYAKYKIGNAEALCGGGLQGAGGKNTRGAG